MVCDLGRLTIVIPVLDEAAIIAAALQALAPLRARGAEIIVVDGGSSDGTAALAYPFADVWAALLIALGAVSTCASPAGIRCSRS
jgi:uncharacterized protein (DUF779 family)